MRECQNFIMDSRLPLALYSVHFECLALFGRKKKKTLINLSGWLHSFVLCKHCDGFTASWFNVFPLAVSTLAAKRFLNRPSFFFCPLRFVNAFHKLKPATLTVLKPWFLTALAAQK